MTTSTKVRDEIATLNRALAEKTAVVDKITDSFEVKDGKVHLNDAQSKAYLEAVDAANQIKTLI